MINRNQLRVGVLWAVMGLLGSAGAGMAQSAKKPAPSSAPAGAFAGRAVSDYRIGPGDVLRVDVWKEPDASMAAAVVQLDGKISLPLIGQVSAEGATPEELQAVLAERFGKIIVDPRVSVMVTTPNNMKVYVLGEVRREGSIRMQSPMTVLQSLAESGGLTDYAKRNRIYILRIVNGQQVRLPFDYDAVLKGRRIEQNVVLQPGDMVVVPR